jgi:hypothetical protein
LWGRSSIIRQVSTNAKYFVITIAKPLRGDFHHRLLGIIVDAANHGRKACEISKIRITADGPSLTNPINNLQTLHRSQIRMIGHGESYTFDNSFLTIGVAPDQLEDSRINVYLVDSLGIEYHHTVTKVNYAIH